MRQPMCVLLMTAVLSAISGAQGLAPRPTVQYITVAVTASRASAPAGAAVTLFADVTPNPSVHIYAQGATDFTPVSIITSPHAALRIGSPRYPKPDVATAQGSSGSVPAYAKPFRIVVPATVTSAAKKGETVTIAGAVRYQACDDRLCYPPTAAPIAWTIRVE